MTAVKTEKVIVIKRVAIKILYIQEISWEIFKSKLN